MTHVWVDAVDSYDDSGQDVREVDFLLSATSELDERLRVLVESMQIERALLKRRIELANALAESYRDIILWLGNEAELGG